MNNAHSTHVITASLVPETQRMAFLPRLFGPELLTLIGEVRVYDALSCLCQEYQGGYWHFYRLSNGGGYLAPVVSAERLTLNCPGRQTTVEVTPDAAGIIATLFALSYLSNDPKHSSDHLINGFHRLRQFALNHHQEAGLIYQAID